MDTDTPIGDGVSPSPTAGPEGREREGRAGGPVVHTQPPILHVRRTIPERICGWVTGHGWQRQIGEDRRGRNFLGLVTEHTTECRICKATFIEWTTQIIW